MTTDVLTQRPERSHDASLEEAGEGVFRLQGRVPHSRELLRLREQGYRILKNQAANGRCTLDLSAVDGSGSVPLALLLSWHRYARALGVELQFLGVPEGLRSMAAVSGLGGFFPASDDSKTD